MTVDNNQNDKHDDDGLKSFIEIKKTQNKALKKMMEKLNSSHLSFKEKHKNNK